MGFFERRSIVDTRSFPGTAKDALLRALPWVLVLVLGSLLLALPPGRPHAFTCREKLRRAPLDHLARCDRGTWVRTSSTDAEYHYHPLFLIDGSIGGGTFEKWASYRTDKRPWVEVRWEEPRPVRRIVLHHAGVRESPRLNTVDFDLKVLADDGWRSVAAVRGNRQSVTVHEIPTTFARAVRVEVLRGSETQDRHARLYELEVRGE